MTGGWRTLDALRPPGGLPFAPFAGCPRFAVQNLGLGWSSVPYPHFPESAYSKRILFKY